MNSCVQHFLFIEVFCEFSFTLLPNATVFFSVVDGELLQEEYLKVMQWGGSLVQFLVFLSLRYCND
jgi:hypothetical protein